MKSFKHQKIFFSFLFLVLLLNFISASEYGYDSSPSSINNIGTVKQYNCITLPQTCNCTWNNITTIMFSDKTYVTINEAMTADGTYFNYTFCNTTLIGDYIVNGVGDKDGATTPFNYWFEVTTTGNNNNNTIPLFLALGGFIIFMLAILTRNLYIGFISGIVFIVLGIYLMVYGVGIISDFYTQTLSYVSLGFGLLIFLSAAYEAITDTGVTLWKKKGGEDEDF
jgi:hypothetical protein